MLSKKNFGKFYAGVKRFMRFENLKKYFGREKKSRKGLLTPLVFDR